MGRWGNGHKNIVDDSSNGNGSSGGGGGSVANASNGDEIGRYAD